MTIPSHSFSWPTSQKSVTVRPASPHLTDSHEHLPYTVIWIKPLLKDLSPKSPDDLISRPVLFSHRLIIPPFQNTYLCLEEHIVPGLLAPTHLRVPLLSFHASLPPDLPQRQRLKQGSALGFSCFFWMPSSYPLSSSTISPICLLSFKIVCPIICLILSLLSFMGVSSNIVLNSSFIKNWLRLLMHLRLSQVLSFSFHHI